MPPSGKQTRGTHNAKLPPPDRVARVLLDAELLGDKAAARRHGVHYKTVVNWRRDLRETAAVSDELKRLRAAVRETWIEEARDLRRSLIRRVNELAGTNPSLRAATEALRRTHEIILSHEILEEDPGAAADALADDAHQHEDSGEAQGARGGAHDDGPDDFGGGEG